MKKILFLILIIFVSCKSTKVIESTKSEKITFKKYSFPKKLRDTIINNTKTKVYRSGLIMNLNLETGCFNYVFNKKEILNGNQKKYWYPILMFDKIYFTASKIINTGFGPASIWYYNRKELLIFNLIEQKSYEVVFDKPINIVLFYEMKDSYSKLSDEEYKNYKYLKSYSIEKIDTEKKELTLFNQSHKLETFKMKELELNNHYIKNNHCD